MFFDYSKKRKLCFDISHAYQDRVFDMVRELAETGKVQEYEQHKERRETLGQFGISIDRKYTPEVNFLYHCCTKIRKYQELAQSLKAVFLKVENLERKLSHVPNEKPHHLKVEPLISHPMLEKLQQSEQARSSEMVIG